MDILDFSWNFQSKQTGNAFAIRTVHKIGSPEISKKLPIELVKYLNEEKTSCYLIAYFRLSNDGYELHFAGDRPFTDILPEEIGSIWVQLGAAQKMLNAYFEAVGD
jgi:hypothetical protein